MGHGKLHTWRPVWYWWEVIYILWHAIKNQQLFLYRVPCWLKISYLLSLFGIHTGCAPLMEILQQTFYGTKTTIAWLLVGKNSWTCAKLQALSYWIITANSFRDIIFHFVFILFFLSFYSLAGLTDTLHMETVMNLHYWCSRCTINL